MNKTVLASSPKKVVPIWDKLLMSGLQRYVMVVECVGNSDAMLSGDDRMHAIWALLEQKKNHTPESIEAYCMEVAHDMLGFNMANAQILRQAHRGY